MDTWKHVFFYVGNEQVILFIRIQSNKWQNKHDYTNLYTSCVAKFSGNWNNTANTGTFQLNVNNSTSNSNTNITAHLLFSKSFIF